MDIYEKYENLKLDYARLEFDNKLKKNIINISNCLNIGGKVRHGGTINANVENSNSKNNSKNNSNNNSSSNTKSKSKIQRPDCWIIIDKDYRPILVIEDKSPIDLLLLLMKRKDSDGQK